MTAATIRISIDFDTPVEISREAHAMIVAGVSAICRDWERANPGQIMWPSGFGAMPAMAWGMVDEDHPMVWVDGVEQIEVTSREAFHERERTRLDLDRARDLRGAVHQAAPALLYVARNLVAAVEAEALAATPQAAEEFDKLLNRARRAVAVAEGREPA